MARYLVLISCLRFIICCVHEERGKKSAMERQELHWQGESGLTNRTFIGLLDPTAMDELVAGWTQEDYAAYLEHTDTELRAEGDGNFLPVTR